jgi:hypothetical protein
MSRIDVVPSDKKFAVLINYGSIGRFEYKSALVANLQAQIIHDNQYPTFEIHLIVIKNEM